jgi:hypothetical protein
LRMTRFWHSITKRSTNIFITGPFAIDFLSLSNF